MPGTGFCYTELSEVFGTGNDVVSIPVPTPVQTSIPVPEVPALMSYRTYRSSRYRYRCRTEYTEVAGIGIDVVPNLPNCPVPVLLYRPYRSVGTGIDAVPNLPKCPVPVLILYRTYRSVRYRYKSLYRYRRYRYPCRTELTEVSKCPVLVLMYRTYRSVRYRY